nr:DUF2868 domain-containing protein [Pseudomonas aeruginosa]
MPLKQFSSALVLAVLLAGCSSNGDGPSTEGASVATGSASAPAATPAADGRCDANAVQAYVGKQASAAIVEEARRAAGAVLVAVELDDRRPWPPKLAEGVADAGILDDGQQRRRLLEQLTRYPPARLAIACDPRRSPDRGTLALLGELARCAASTRIWLLQAPPGEALDSDRLGDWHAALERLQLPHGETSPLAWLETGHD